MQSGQTQISWIPKINSSDTIGYNDQSLKYQTLGEKINTLLNSKNVEINPEMIEKFYFRLLPVTYRDWMRK